MKNWDLFGLSLSILIVGTIGIGIFASGAYYQQQKDDNEWQVGNQGDLKMSTPITNQSEPTVTLKLTNPIKSTFSKCSTDENGFFGCGTSASTFETQIPVSQFLQMLADEYKYQPEKTDSTTTPAKLLKK